jgi:hypothetical protein
MIVRILGEGQLSVADAAVGELNDLDSKLSAAVDVGDEAGFRTAHEALLARVRALGTPLDPGSLQPSELILPQDGATMEDVRKLLTDDGLIPG